MPNVEWNKEMWTDLGNWRGGGELWSKAWGNSEAQWFGSLYPRIRSFLPAATILEIAPGFGRWTRFLAPSCDKYYGVDLSEECVKHCQERFQGEPHMEFAVNDGKSLAMIPDQSVDLVYSFDSLVHVEIDVLKSYIPQILSKLKPRGVAFVHHSNLMVLKDRTVGLGYGRAESVSAVAVSDIVSSIGGHILRQEIVDWDGVKSVDTMTLFSHRGAYEAANPVVATNDHFMDEAHHIRTMVMPWQFDNTWTAPQRLGEATLERAHWVMRRFKKRLAL
jgi:SAM-dependent methyltransferase